MPRKTTAKKIKRLSPAAKKMAAQFEALRLEDEILRSKAQDLDTGAILCKALCELYPCDKIAPRLVLAWLPEKSLYYASIVRYDNERKQIVANGTAATIGGAIATAAQNWYNGTRAASPAAKTEATYTGIR